MTIISFVGDIWMKIQGGRLESMCDEAKIATLE